MVVVGRERDPDRLWGAVPALGEVDRDHLPVALVIVDAAECGAPVVHRVEEPVLQAHVAALSDDASVVREAVRLEPFAIRGLGRGGHPRRHLAAQQQRRPHPSVDQPTEHAGGGEPGGGAESLTGQHPPAQVLGMTERLLDEAKEQWPVAIPGRLRQQALQRQLPRRHDLRRIALRTRRPEAALSYVRTDRSREEQLSLGVADDRLIGPPNRARSDSRVDTRGFSGNSGAVAAARGARTGSRAAAQPGR